MAEGLRQIIYPVTDLAKAKTLYSELLGVRPYADEAYYVGFRVDDQELGLDPNGHRKGMTGPGRYAAQHLPAPGGARDGGDAVARGETGDQTDQESRSAGHRAAARVTVMDITIHASFLPHDDPDASLAFYRDTLGFEVRNDVAYGGMRWITVGPADQAGTSISGLPVRL